MKLDGKVVLITGGTTGIGAATARLFWSEGAKVIVTGHSEESAEAAKPSLPGVEVVVSDQADPQASKRLVQQIKDRYGCIDILFANAGISRFATLDETDEAIFNSIFNVNVRGLYFTVKHAVTAMPSGGAILFTGSMAGRKGFPQLSVYSATKAALRSLARTLAAELAPRNIRVNIIGAGPIETPIFGKVGLSQEQQDSWVENTKSQVPLGRIGRAEEVAAAALFLAADASYTTGGEIVVAGGLVDL